MAPCINLYYTCTTPVLHLYHNGKKYEHRHPYSQLNNQHCSGNTRCHDSLPESLRAIRVLGITTVTNITIAIFAGILLTSLTAGIMSKPTSDTFELGTVKWFNVKKGYGFITRDQGDDVFVHFRNIQGSGRRSISDGQRVEFIVTTGDKGLQADEVSPID
jgi:CspA family cold shock protein